MIDQLMVEYLPLTIRSNSPHRIKGLVKAIKHTARENISLEATDKEISTLSADGVFYHLKKLSLEDVISFFNAANERIVRKAAKMLRKPVIVAIDFHDVPYYGDRNSIWILGCKRVKSTNYCFRYATIEVVEENKRLTLATIPINAFIAKETAIRRLIEKARKYVKINVALLDRYFFASEVIKTLQEMKIDFLMPAVLNKRIMYMKRSKYNYEMKGVKFNLIVNDYKWATNLKWIPKKLERIYKKRWGIETGYRVKKDFKIKTCTRNPVIRFLFFCVQVLMYNIWTNIRKLPDYIKRYGNRVKTITTRLFKVKILDIT